MKKKGNGRVQYVQQFRKISALQKLPTLKQGFGDLFFQNKNQNGKFIRLKQQPIINQIQLNTRNQIFCENYLLNPYIKDKQIQSRQDVQEQINNLNDQINQYNKWADNLMTFVRRKKYRYQFQYLKSGPPAPLSKQSLQFDPLKTQVNTQSSTNNTPSINDLISQTIINNKKKRYDFKQITQYLMNSKFDQDDNNDNIDLIKKDMELYRKYKNMKDIMKIEEVNLDYDRYQYNFNKQWLMINNNQSVNPTNNVNVTTGNNNIISNKENKPISSLSNNKPISSLQNNNTTNKQRQQDKNDQFNFITEQYKAFNQNKYKNLFHEQKKNFKYLSVLKSKLSVDINFFRDIGPVSRNPQQFIQQTFLDNLPKNTQNELMLQDQNPFIREKMDTHLLHYLQTDQLKIDKNNLNFNDIANISMTRMTSTNAHMCIRSEKVTRAQYEKLLKKMEKLYKMQNQDGKTRQNKQISTQDIVQDNKSMNTNNKNQLNNPKSLSTHKLVQQINLIRRQIYSLKSPKQPSYNLITPNTLDDQISKKLYLLLQSLYLKVINQLPFNYSLLEIGFHIDQVNKLSDDYYDEKKLIWFIMTVLEEIEKRKTYNKNIMFLNNKIKKDGQPKMLKYRGEKIVAKDKMGTRNPHGTALVMTNRQKSIPPLRTANFALPTNSKTPTKDLSKSPIKNTTSNKNTTASKYQNSTTPTKRKY